jgi:hypothetical protein
MRTSLYPFCCLVSNLFEKGQYFMLRIVLGGLGTFGVGLARLVNANEMNGGALIAQVVSNAG